MKEVRLKVKVDRQQVDQLQQDVQRIDGKAITLDVDKAAGSAQKFSASLLSAYKNMLKFSLASAAIYAPIRALRDGLKALEEIDAELTTIKKVTGGTSEEITALGEKMTGLAKAYGAVTTSILEAASTFSRAGYTGTALEAMTELSALTQNVGDVTADTAAKFLLATDAAFKFGGSEEKLMSVVDGLNEITNKHATDFDKLTDGMTVAASVFAEAGEDVQTFAALLGAGTAATQRSGNEIARGLRTILMNIRQIRGETENGELIDSESTAKAAEALKDYAGISTIANGELRKASDVLDELAGKWDKLDSVAQSAISEALAGKRQANILMALMGDWDEVHQMMTEYADAAGSAARENEIMMSSLQKQLDVLKTTWIEFVSDLADTDVLKGSVNLLTDIVEGADSFIKLFDPAWEKQDRITQELQNQYDALVTEGGEYDLLLARASELNEWEKLRLSYLTQQKSKLSEQIKVSKSLSYQEWQNQYGSGKVVSTRYVRNNAANIHEHKAPRVREDLTQDVVYLSEFGDALTKLEKRYAAGELGLRDYADALGELRNKYQTIVEPLRQYQNQGRDISDAQAKMISLYDSAGTTLSETAKKLDEATVSTSDYVQALISEKTQAGKTGSELYNLVQAEIAANNQNLNFSQQIAALRTLATQAGYAASAIAAVFGMDENSMSNQIRAAANGLMMAGKAKTSQDAMRMAKQNYMNALWGSLTNFYTPESSGSPSGGKSSGEKPSSGSAKSQTDKQLEAHKENVSLLKSELTLMEKQGKSVGEQVEKIKTIQNALHRQAEYMRSIGASQDEINALSAEWYDWQEKIAELQKSLLSELDSAVQKKLDEAKANRDAELDAIQAQIDALKEKNEAEDTALAIEEKRAAITERQNELLEKQKALLDARNERTVRTYNAKTNQWEWIADEKNVKNAEDALKSAQDALEKAKDDLADYNKKLDRDAEIAALEAKKKQINAHYDALENAWDRIMDSLNDPVREINDILKDIAENATPALREQILKNRDLFEALGIDLSMFGDRVEQTANRLVKVLANGSAPGGLGAGDRVVTGGGTYEITGVRPDGSYESTLVDKNQTTGNYNEEYNYGPPSPSRRIAKVRSDGSAPPGLSVGDWVVTAGGTCQITAVNPDGSYQSAVIDQSTTTGNYTGRYDVYDQGGWLNGTGGIKATDRPETVLPPSLTEKLLSPAADATFQKRMSELGFLYGTTDRMPVTVGGTVTNSNVTNNYSVNGVKISAQEARSLSFEEVLRRMTQLGGSLGNYNNM